MKWRRGLGEHDTCRELEGVQDDISQDKGIMARQSRACRQDQAARGLCFIHLSFSHSSVHGLKEFSCTE